ncbi:MAG: copper amine oxidase N-terminal domain-containing protein [Firmicutes bacterium]|nr:copper amine oxidase N-terminal domain-containing protein [Bacillota bacterium]
MKSVFTRLLLIFSLTLALLLVPSAPARADAGVELASVTLSIDGQDQPLEFSPDKLEYKISHTAAAPVEITVEAQAAAGCKLRIDNVPYEDGCGSATWSTSESCIINLQVYYKTHSQIYLIHVTIEPPAPSTPSGQGGDSGGNGQSSGNGNAPANGGQGSGSGSSPANGEQGSGSGSSPANGGQDSGNGSSPANGGQGSGNGSSPANGGPSAPEPAGPGAGLEQSGADPADEPHTTHLILYIGAPFLFADETYIPADTAPYLVTDANGGGYTMVPVRFIAEALGASVSWDGTARKVGVDLDGRHFELTIGQLVPGTPVAAVIRDSRTFVPLRYVMESFGARVEWTQREQRIDIYYAPQSLLK